MCLRGAGGPKASSSARRLGDSRGDLEILLPAGWEIPWEDVEILRRPDGSDWLLGEGRYGKVYKALKGGVQVCQLSFEQIESVMVFYSALLMWMWYRGLLCLLCRLCLLGIPCRTASLVAMSANGWALDSTGMRRGGTTGQPLRMCRHLHQRLNGVPSKECTCGPGGARERKGILPCLS